MTKKILLCFAFIFSIVTNCVAQQQSLNWINEHAFPIDSTNDSYLNYLRDQLKDNEILGLAEASHGTHEFFTEKNRIIKYLVTHAQYRSVGFELPYLSLVPLNDYVLTGKGDLRQMMKSLSLYNTTELHALFQFIKTYNETQKPENKVSVFGFDGEYSKPTIDKIALYCLNYLSKKDSQHTNATAAMIVFKKIPSLNNLSDLTDDESAALRLLHDEVKDDLTGTNSRHFKKYLSILYQTTLAYDPLSRDQSMAENIVATQQGSKAKTIILAHNVHMAKDTTAGYQGMGYHVRQQYQDRYHAIGFDMYKGSVTVLDGYDTKFESHKFEAGPETLSALFNQAKWPAFFLPFNKELTGPLCNNKRFIINIYANWRGDQKFPIKPGIDFDDLIFIRETTASKELK